MKRTQKKKMKQNKNEKQKKKKKYRKIRKIFESGSLVFNITAKKRKRF